MYRTRSPLGPKARLRLELLEGREVPATIYALSAADHLMTFDSSNPTVLLGNVPITGLANPGETITDIDVRPGSGGLYGRSTDGLLYLINPLSGQASQIGQAVPTDIGNVGTDFDPVTDRLWVTSNGGQILAINPNGGTVAAAGGSLTYLPGDYSYPMPARVTSIAFTNSFPLSSSTTEFGIDHVRDTLVAFTGAPGKGQIVTVGSIGIAMKANNVGFDIDPSGNVGYASIQVPGAAYSLFCEINLSTGAATVISPIGSNRLITDIAVARSTITGTGLGTTTVGTGLGTTTGFTTGTTPFGSVVTAGPLTTTSGTSFGGTMFNNTAFNTGLLGGTFFSPTTGSFVTSAALAGNPSTAFGVTGFGGTTFGGTLTNPLAPGLTSTFFPGAVSAISPFTGSLFPSLAQPLSSAPLASTISTGALPFFAPSTQFVSTTPNDLMSGIFGSNTLSSGTFGAGTPLLSTFGNGTVSSLSGSTF